MLFEGIVGNEKQKKLLARLSSHNTLAHTILFYGLSGIGKSLFALELSYALMYPEYKKDPSFVLPLQHPDLHEYFPEGKTGMHNIASIRSMMEVVSLQPYASQAKVCIIHSAERMLSSGANALLKTLEEPMENTYIILLAEKKESLLPTICSRCLKLFFSPLSEKELSLLFEKKYPGISLDRKNLFLSQGSFGRAISLFEQERYQMIKKHLDHLLTSSNTRFLENEKALDALEEVMEEVEDPVEAQKDIDFLFSYILCYFQDVCLKDLSVGNSYFDPSQLSSLKGDSFRLYQNALEKIGKCRESLSRNVKLSVVLEYFFEHHYRFAMK